MKHFFKKKLLMFDGPKALKYMLQGRAVKREKDIARFFIDKTTDYPHFVLEYPSGVRIAATINAEDFMQKDWMLADTEY